MMQARTKSALMLLSALLVGGLIGALTTSTVMHNRVEELQALRMPGGPLTFLERAIEPIDDAQRDRIQAVLAEQGKRLREIRMDALLGHRAVMDSTRRALDTVLTAEQKEMLRKRLEEDRRRGRGPRLGPPGEDRPFERRRRRGDRPGGPPGPVPADSTG